VFMQSNLIALCRWKIELCKRGSRGGSAHQSKQCSLPPETPSNSRLLTEALKQAADFGNVSFVVVDEAHCVDMWSDSRC
jgi:superfamily II DNA helicase RecQ